jgi:hypothetical protein
MQSVGHMGVIPILDDGGQDESFAPPDLDIGTSDYGTVNVRNRSSDQPTIVPTGAGWVVDQAAQDHAVPGAKFVKAGGRASIDTAMCIQSGQGGYISNADHAFLVLPAPLRAKALSMRKEKGYSRLWDDIGKFNGSLGANNAGHLEYFLQTFASELDQFVAQFELVPGQVGAVILLDGRVVGVERAPNIAFWEKVWHPLIRVCYGALAIKARKKLGDTPPKHRVPLHVEVKSLAGINRALAEARGREYRATQDQLREVKREELEAAAGKDDSMAKYQLLTIANGNLAGQIALKGTSPTPSYVSLCASGA